MKVVGASERAALAAVCLACSLFGAPTKSSAAYDLAAPVMSEARLRIAVGANDQSARKLTIGLFDDLAPASVRTFKGLCDDTLLPGASYRGATVSRVERDKLILANIPYGGSQDVERSIDSTGYVRSVLRNRADEYRNSDANDLMHDRPGMVSMQAGGGDFRFAIAPTANPALDKQRVVIGQILLNDLDSSELLREINEIPVRQPKAETSLYLALGKVGGDPRTRVDTVFRPLRKITISDCRITRSPSASFETSARSVDASVEQHD